MNNIVITNIVFLVALTLLFIVEIAMFFKSFFDKKKMDKEIKIEMQKKLDSVFGKYVEYVKIATKNFEQQMMNYKNKPLNQNKLKKFETIKNERDDEIGKQN